MSANPFAGGFAGGLILAGHKPKPTSNGLREQATRAAEAERLRLFEEEAAELRGWIRSAIKISVEPYQVESRNGRPTVEIDGLLFRRPKTSNFYNRLEVQVPMGMLWRGINNLADLGKVLKEDNHP